MMAWLTLLDRFGGTLYSYAGIFGTTDLGAPITDDKFSATWAGKFRIFGDSIKDFTLAVTFGGTDGTVKAFLENISGFSDFSIDGRFGVNGVITGKVHFASATHPTSPDGFNGTLSGIIGSDGAVGVFHATG